MTLRAKRHPRNRLMVVGALSVLTFACNGSIMDGPGGSGTGPGAGPGAGPGSPGSGGGNPDPGNNAILPPPPGAMNCTSKEFTPARVWRLSDDQYVAAVKDLLPGVTVPTILTPGRSAQQFVDFAELFEIGAATASDIRNSANAAAAEAVKNVDGLLACKGGEAPAACVGRFIDGFASRAFRRPLEQMERDGLKAVYDAGVSVNQAEGIRMVITAVLQSGSFLYRTELGKANTVAAGQTVELTPHELASSLSFLFLNSIPDPELRAAADATGDQSLAKPEVFKSQVERLLKLPRVQDQLTVVFLKWVGLGTGLNADLAVQEKEFVPALKASMEEELRLFVKQLLGGGGTINELLTSNKGFTDRVLATHMGMQAPSGMGFQPANYPAEQRAGILTLPGIIARYSLGHPEVFRGKYIRDEFLCMEIPPPPNLPEIEEETKASENLPPRQQAMRRLQNGTCGACHLKMDPIGLSFSNYDALGRFKTTDAMGAAIDSTGELAEAGDADGPLKNAVELGQRLARSEKARTCIESKMLGYALGRSISYEYEGDIDRCEVRKIDGFVNQGGGKLSDLMAAVVFSSAFRFRTGGN
jgi:Protein of unknown function (DUF1592)/Protein of unknown function (DUF1588)/Protein of unknown function (DUF1595)/Protein of unknown function (DUF1585)